MGLNDSTKKERISLPRSSNWLDIIIHRVLIVYRRLFSLVWLANIAVFLIIIFVPKIDRIWISQIALINLTIAVVIRQDFVINLIYVTCCSAPKSWPLFIRKRLAKVYHLGGIHSGCASATVCWYAGNFVYSLRENIITQDRSAPSIATIVLSAMALVLLSVTAATAYPSLRKHYHNKFEAIHRFFGWTILALVWVQTILTIWDTDHARYSFGMRVLKSPSIWLLVVITISIATNWAFLKKVPVGAVRLSDHAVQLHFQYTRPVKGGFVRVSERPLVEWHSFATIPAPTNKEYDEKSFSLIVSRAGDWTSRQISNPPTQLWIRGVPTCGVMRVAALFQSVVLVGTGSGIAPLLGHVPSCPLRLVWSTPNPVETFGQDIIDQVYDADPNAVIHDTRRLGRPDLVTLALAAKEEINAEAIITISNEKVTKLVVGALERKGIPAYGAIWDS